MAQNGLFPISFQRHYTRSWHRFSSYAFARTIVECDIVRTEIPSIASAFPIVFRVSGHGVQPVAILSTPGKTCTPFVSESGQWLAGYIPAVLRCHPFLVEPLAPSTQGSPVRVSMLVNESTGHVTQDRSGNPFFEEDRTPSSELQVVQTFFKSFLAEQLATLHACELIDKTGLFCPLTSVKGVDIPDTYLGVDFEKLCRLSPAQTSILMSSGALQLIYAHQISLSHFELLHRLDKGTAASMTPRSQSENDELNGFLGALAAAHSSTELEAGHAYF